MRAHLSPHPPLVECLTWGLVGAFAVGVAVCVGWSVAEIAHRRQRQKDGKP